MKGMGEDERADLEQFDVEAVVPRPHPTPCSDCASMLADIPDAATLPMTLDDGSGISVTGYIWPCGAVTYGNAYADKSVALTGPFLEVRRRRGSRLSN